jgi:hypothetical protein
MFRSVFLILFLSVISFQLFSQDTLPNFTVQNIGNGKIRISWVNPYPNATTVLVQRSFDSTKNFRTIFSAQSPELPQNGYLDTKAPWDKMFYRIYYVINETSYFFSVAKRPAMGYADPVSTVRPEGLTTVTIKVRDTVYLKLAFDDFVKFRDSIITKTKDSLFTINATEVLLKPYFAKELWKPSPYVYTNREGYINIYLPLFKDRKYRLVIFDDDGTKLFEIKHVKEQSLVLDKANFYHAGWFSFDLYEDDKLKERNKFYLQPDF